MQVQGACTAVGVSMHGQQASAASHKLRHAQGSKTSQVVDYILGPLTVDCSAERSASAAPSQARANRMKKKSAMST